jgi:hypothetical protein
MSQLKFFKKTNVPGTYVLAGLHWNNSITWRWTLWWTNEFFIAPKIKWYKVNVGWIYFRWFFGELSFYWQDNMWKKTPTANPNRGVSE